MSKCITITKATLGRQTQLGGLNQSRVFSCRQIQRRISRKTRLQVLQQDVGLNLDDEDEDLPPPPPPPPPAEEEVQEIQETQEGELQGSLEGQELEQEEEVQVQEGEAEVEQPESMEFMSTGSYLVDFKGNIPQMSFGLNFIWQEKTLGISVDQLFLKDQRAPITEYFFWPTVDAWEELRLALEQQSWIQEVDQIMLMNRCTEVINYWQEEGVFHSKEEAEASFSDCIFFA
eukprot:TRINITY_DN31204_c1_g1_i1.p1 TRINITY_DN31204_c1_g1~~TRINITY_DN31204_c1_g1_i1.p1  ORF type:complete len:231 (-),score=50.04 TRINITY_DN31204_c1_g1_i1:219-911(-)